MSKVVDARASQGYTDDARKCGRCAHYTSTYSLPAWMREENAECEKQGLPARWSFNHQLETNRRCGLGGFAIKKQGICRLFEPKEKAS